MERLVLIDSNSLIYRAFYAMAPLSDSKGRPVQAVYGFTSMLARIIKELKPTHIAAAFDLKAPTFRHEMYKEYKGTRKPMPEELVVQVPILKEFLAALKIEVVEKAGWEADDIIGTLAAKTQFDTVIVSGDRDTLQLIDSTTRVWLTRKGISQVEEYDLVSLKNAGFTPHQIIELKALMGDASDNIPGVAGVGEKTAMTLLGKYGSLDEVYSHIDEIQGKLKENLISNKKIAYLSERLATIDLEAPIECGCEKYRFQYPFDAHALEKFHEMEFKSLISRFEFNEAVETLPEATLAPAEKVYIENENTLAEFAGKVKKSGMLALVIDKDIYAAINGDMEYIIKVQQDLFGGMSYDAIIGALSEVLANPSVKKLAYDYKSLKHQLNGRIEGMTQDLMLKAYVAKEGAAPGILSDTLTSYGMDIETPASGLFRLDSFLERKLTGSGTLKLYYDIELPLIGVLYDMEITGFKVDTAVLEQMAVKFREELNTLSEAIYAHAGKQFNINSPRQLSDVLTNQLYLKTGKKNKTGLSTSADVLIKLRKDHPIIDLVLSYRHISKMLSTYIDGFRAQIESDGRIHTVFKQALTSTGRLSSTEPNLQNIPIRDEVGRDIRRMFIATPGNILVAADYSQIELRLLAHFSGDPKLVESYLKGEDIHSRTAAEIFGLKINEVSHEMRRNAKAVNFGIIYGISAFGLSENADISVRAAKEYIEKYFATYPKVKEYMEENVRIAKEDGRIRTITGRVRYIPELKSHDYNVRNFGERAAMNMPLQGSSADIIKIAMLEVYKALKNAGLKSKLILQIHDELIIDAYPGEAEQVKQLLKGEMESAVRLRVPLIADVSSGASLYEAK